MCCTLTTNFQIKYDTSLAYNIYTLLYTVKFNKMKKQFRKTYRHEVIIEAETKEEAQQIWESISLGKLDQEVADGEIYSHEFVENVSFEDENYDDV